MGRGRRSARARRDLLTKRKKSYAQDRRGSEAVNARRAGQRHRRNARPFYDRDHRHVPACRARQVQRAVFGELNCLRHGGLMDSVGLFTDTCYSSFSLSASHDTASSSVCPPCSRPQDANASKTGRKLLPSGVNEYSTFGGTSAYTWRWIRPSFSNCLSSCVSILGVTDPVLPAVPPESILRLSSK